MVSEILPWIALVLRLVLGILFTAHGFPKLRSPERAATHLLKLGMPLPKLSAIVLGIVEFFGGIALIIGFETRIVATLLVIIMAIGAYRRKTNLKEKFVEGYMLELILAIALAAQIFLGAGKLSIDKILGWLLG